MTTALTTPVTYDAANRWLAARVNVPTTLGSRQLALSKDFPASVKAHSFFSAKVAEANVLESIRESADKYARGEANLATARAELKQKLRGLGVATFDPADKDDRNIRNLGSTARLDLIFTQQARMAAAVGQREVAMDPDMLERWPYFRFVPSTSKNQRDSHKQFYNLVLPKTDPFWQTHTPPLDFRCQCAVEDCDEDEARDFGGVDKAVSTGGSGTAPTTFDLTINGQPLHVPPNASGYLFDVESAFKSCDMSLVKDTSIRRHIFNSIHAKAKADNLRFVCVPGKAEATLHTIDGDFVPAKQWLDAQAKASQDTGSFMDGQIELGKLSAELRDALGMSEAGRVFLSRGTTAFGLEHTAKRHAQDILDGSFASALFDTLYARNVKTTLVVEGGKTLLTTLDPESGAFTTLKKFGESWDWQVVSSHYAGKHGEGRQVLRK